MQQGKNIPTVTLEELFSENTSSSLPILVDIMHEDIIWQSGDMEQENGHLRLINDTTPVRYRGSDDEPKLYAPSCFSFTPPSEDGKTIGNTKITISALDQRIIQIIRSVSSKCKVRIVAFFAKQDTNFYFTKVYQYEFEMDSVTWDGVTASWNLVFNPSLQLNIPRDLGTATRFPSVKQN